MWIVLSNPKLLLILESSSSNLSCLCPHEFIRSLNKDSNSSINYSFFVLVNKDDLVVTILFHFLFIS